MEPGIRKDSESRSETTFCTPMGHCSITKPVAAPSATSVPPSSTKRRSASTPAEPIPPRYVSGMIA